MAQLRRSKGKHNSLELGTTVSADCKRDLGSLLQSVADEVEQCLCRGIVSHAEVFVDLGVVGFFGTEDGDGNAGLFEHRTESKGLGRVIRVIGDVQDQERRGMFPPFATCVTAEKSRCFSGVLPNFSR